MWWTVVGWGERAAHRWVHLARKLEVLTAVALRIYGHKGEDSAVKKERRAAAHGAVLAVAVM